MLRRTITKGGIKESADESLEQDREDVMALMALPAWNRYYLRKVETIRQKLLESFPEIKGDSVVPFKELQAKLVMLDELKAIPEIDCKNFQKGV